MFIEGQIFKFRADNTNTRVTVRKGRKTIVLNKNGNPLKAGDIKPGEVISFDKNTGEVTQS